MGEKKASEPLIFSRATVWLFWILLIALLYSVWLVYRIYLFPFFVALISYLILRKPYLHLSQICGNRRNLASVLAVFFTILIILTPFFLLVQALVRELLVVVGYLENWLTQENLYRLYEENEKIRQIIQRLNLKVDFIQEKFLGMTTNFGSVLIEQSKQVLSGIFSIIFNFIIAMISLFFLFREGDKIPPYLYQLLPFPDDIEEEVGNRLLGVLDVIVKGTGFISLSQGLAVGIYFWLFGLSTPILYGSLAAFFSLIPVVGTMAVWLPGSFYLYWNGYVWSAICLSGISLITYLVLENIIKPWFLDKKLSLHPLFLFLSILGGVNEFGIQGFILGPFVVITFLIILEIMKTWGTIK